MPDRYGRPDREMYGRPLNAKVGSIEFINCRVVDDPDEQAALDAWNEQQSEFEAQIIAVQPRGGRSVALLALLGLVAWIVLIIGAVVVLS